MIRVGGVRSVTMRSVADALGVRAASLYYHVEDKDALLDLVLVEVGTQLGPAVIDEYRTVESLGEWIDATRRTTLMAYDFHAQHPGIATLMLTRAFGQQGRYPTISTIAVVEADALVRAGMPQPDAYRIYQAIARFTLAEIAADTSDPNERSAVRRDMFIDGVDVFIDGIRWRTEERHPEVGAADPPVVPGDSSRAVALQARAEPRKRAIR
jgi:TetR/AcrR family transcriptional regulator, tetracycline repressor protein